MGKKRGKVLEELILEVLRNKVLSDPIFVKSILEYTDDNTFVNPRSIPDLQTVTNLLQSGAVVYDQYTVADLDGNGNLDISSLVQGDNKSLGVRVNFDYTAVASGDNPFFPATEGYFELYPQNVNGLLYISDQPPTSGLWTNIIVFATGINVVPPPAPSPPVFTLQPPANATIVQQRTLSLTIAATGAIGYQWQKDGVNISGQITDTLTVTNFNSGKSGTYTCIAYNSDGSTTSTGCLVANDVGLILGNLSDRKSDNTPNGAGRAIAFTDGAYSASIVVNSFDRVSTAATSITITQNGVDDLTLYDGVNTFAPLVGGNVPNVIIVPSGGWLDMYTYNDN